MNKLKTSISLPLSAKPDWQLHRGAIQSFLSTHLYRQHSEELRRIGLREFNDCAEGLVRFNVYWSQEIYDQLHAVAHALRVSVSHLLWRILNFVLSGEQLDEIFSNYEFIKQEWSPRSFVYTEVIRFSGNPHQKSRRKTPYRFTR